MIRRPPRSPLERSRRASDVYKRQHASREIHRRYCSGEKAKRLLGFESRVTLEDGIRRIIAVSYTHLRAHETVLDLVCRLLLEKTTQKTKQKKKK